MSESRPKTPAPRPTAETELAFVEDFRWLAEMINRDPISHGEIRRSSAVMRRLFPDGRDFQTLCNFHAPKPFLNAHDNRSYYRSAERGAFVPFFVSGGRGFLNSEVRGLTPGGWVDHDPEDEASLGDTTLIPLEAWMNQKVLCFRGKWITRTNVINYVANRAFGVHSGKDKTDLDESMSKLRGIAKLSVAPEGHFRLNLSSSALYGLSPDFTPTPGELDVVLFEYSCAIRLFVESPDAIALCDKLAPLLPASPFPAT
jgi:hypothetical protein